MVAADGEQEGRTKGAWDLEAEHGEVTLGLGALHSRVHLVGAPVAHRHLESLGRHVQREILPHHRETIEPNVTIRFGSHL